MSDSVENSTPKTTKPKKIKRPKQCFDLVEIWWDDAAELRPGWISTVEEPHSQMAISVGFLIRKTDEYVMIAQDLDVLGMHNGRSQYPMGMVKHMKILRKKDADGTEQIQDAVCSKHIQD